MADNSGRGGILLERIKVAQHTIDSLSAKVFFYENERTLLKEKKEHFETGYYKLVEENSQLLNDTIHKDTLLKKLTMMEGEIGVLLKTQDGLQERHVKQTASIESYKQQIDCLQEENQAVKKVNEELGVSAAKAHGSVEKLKASEENLKNQSIVSSIEKETLASEVNRLINKLKSQDEKLRRRKEKEQDLVKENSVLRQDFISKMREMRQLEKNLVYLEDQFRATVDEKEDATNQSRHDIAVVNEEIEELQRSLAQSKQSLTAEAQRASKVKEERDALEQKLNDTEKRVIELESSLNHNQSAVDDLRRLVHDGETKTTSLERDNSSLRQRIRNLKQENGSLTSTIKSNEEQTSASLIEKDRLVEELKHEVQKLEAENSTLIEHSKSDLQAFTIESENGKRFLQEQIVHLQMELESITQHFTEYKSEQANCLNYSQLEIKKLKEANKSLTEKSSTSEKRVERLTSDLEATRKDLQKSRRKHDTLNLEFDEMAKCKDALSKQVDQYAKENKLLKKKSTDDANLMDKLDMQSKSEITTQKAIYENKLKLMESDYDSMKMSLREAEQEKAICVETYKKQISAIQQQSDTDMEQLTQERDEISASLQTANLDLEEYKNKFNSLTHELDEVSTVNADLKLNLSLLSKELESYQQDGQSCLEKDEEIFELQEIVSSLRKREEEMAITLSRSKNQNTEHADSFTSLQHEVASLKSSLDNKERDWETRSSETSATITDLRNSQRELQFRNDKLKAECRKRAVQSHATCGELQLVKTDLNAVKKELEVVVELNKKLEMVNETLQQENRDLVTNAQQLEHDIGVLKSSYEDLLSKELSKQKSEFLLKENQLLKRLSSERFDTHQQPRSGSPMHQSHHNQNQHEQYRQEPLFASM